MDPSSKGADQWSEIGSLLTKLWIVVLFVVLFAANMLLAHNMMPSLLATRDIPAVAQKARPVFYFFGIVSFAVAIVFMTMVIDEADVLRRFWADYWI